MFYLLLFVYIHTDFYNNVYKNALLYTARSLMG